MAHWSRAIAHGSIITLATITHSTSAFVAPGPFVLGVSNVGSICPDAIGQLHRNNAFVVGGLRGRGRTKGLSHLKALEADSEGPDQKKERVLEEMQEVLLKKKGMLAEEIEQLELARARAQEEERKEEQKVERKVDDNTNRENQGDEERDPPRLPTGWDSLPWSQGYKDAVKRADQRQTQTESEENWDGGVDRRSVLDSVLQGVLVVGIFVGLGLVGNPSQEDIVENQMRFVSLITDLTKGVQFVGTTLSPAVYAPNLEKVQELCAPGGELESSLVTPMEAWARMQGPDLAPIQKSRVSNVRAEAASLRAAAQQGDVLAMRAAYRQLTVDVNGFVLSVNANAPPTTDLTLPQVPQARPSRQSR